jgi:CRP/FNR family nitrogen fixation transcriptional regulator
MRTQTLTPTTCGIREWKFVRNLASPLGSLEALSSVATFTGGEPVYLSGEPVDFWYRILSGAARQCALSFEGNRQIVDFLRPGDLFGYAVQDMHSFSVEAIIRGTTVARYPRLRAEGVADSDPHVARRIRELAFESVYRGQRRLLIIGRGSALEKVSNFLLEMADRFRAGPVGPVTLPMSRYDIADYLAMAVETVSRALTILRDRGVVQFEGARRMQIRDRCALEKAAESSTADAGTCPSSARYQRHRDRHMIPVAFGLVGEMRSTPELAT